MTMRLRVLLDPQRRDSGSMLLALLALLMTGSIVLVLTATVIGGEVSVRHDRHYTGAVMAADVGIQRASFLLNQRQYAKMPTAASPATGTEGGIPYRWWATKVSDVRWDITSEATEGGVTRTLTTRYQQDPRAPLALFGDKLLSLNGSNMSQSYNSTTGTADTGNGKLGSNGTIAPHGSSTMSDVDGVVFYDWKSNPDPTRCDKSCIFADTIQLDKRLDISSPSAMKFITDRLAACSASAALTDWVSSTAGSTLAPKADGSPYCFRNVTFDSNTTITGTAANPVVIYMSGIFTTKKNQADYVNCGGCYSGLAVGPSAVNFQVYSSGTAVNMGGHSFLAGVFYAPLADCDLDSQGQLYGALVCGTTDSNGGWEFRYDDALSGIGDGMWRTKGYAES